MFRFTHKDKTYRIHAYPELSIGNVIPWCIQVGDGLYQVSTAADWATADGKRFVKDKVATNWMLTPGLTASKRFPLLLSIDRIAVRAWPEFLPRGTGAKTFENQKTGLREITTKRWPSWMFETEKRPASPFGTMTGEQTVADIIDLAKAWLHLGEHG